MKASFLGENDINEYLTIVELSGVTEGHIKEVKRALRRYLKYVKYKPNKTKSLEYFKKLQQSFSIAYYKKQMYQIKKLLSYLGMEWQNEIRLPPDPNYFPKRITITGIQQTLSHFKKHHNYSQIRALVLLGATSGMRAEELYQLQPNDIDLSKRTVSINHNLSNNQSTKTGESRISFFNDEACSALKDHLDYFNNGSKCKSLFSQSHIIRIFRESEVKVKDLRKFFSQEWDRQGGPTSIKKMLMGHSGDVDTYHYNAQSEDDLRNIYDNVGIKINYNSEEANLKRKGYKLVDFIAEKTGVKINLVYEGTHEEDDGKTVCKNNRIIVYWNESNWKWLREVIVHESAHRLDHKLRGNMHHNSRYSHDDNYWKCYNEIDTIAKESSFWNLL